MKLTYKDDQHAYYLDGKRCKSITTVAKIPDDTYALDQWRKRQVAIGFAVKPELVEQAAAHFDDKDQLNRIAEEAMTAAKSHDAANRGTAMHRITERHDMGLEILETPLSRAVRAAWQRALELAGLEIVPELVERIVVYPERRICGRFDRLARRIVDGRFVVVDLKTGAGAVKYPHSIATQLGLYANAPLMAAPLPPAGGTTEQFEPLPDMDRTVGYIVHMPTPEQVEIVGVDIAAGWAAADRLCFGALDWRAKRDLVFPVVEVPITTTEETTDNDSRPTPSGSDGSVDVAGDQPATSVPESETPVPAVDSTETERSDSDRAGGHVRGAKKSSGTKKGSRGSEPDAKQARKKAHAALEIPGTPENHAVPAEHRYSWLRARLQAIMAKDDLAGAVADIKTNWPDGVPTLKTFDHDDDRLDRITQLLDRVEADYKLPFGGGLRDFLPATEPETVAAVVEAFPGSTVLATDDEKKPYQNWLRQFAGQHPETLAQVKTELETLGLRKSLSADEWTPDELQKLSTVLRRAERAARSGPTATDNQQQLAS